jgi:DNA-binding transcriptional MerR regulator
VDDQLLTIGELGRRTGVATSALRYYEELGLLRPAGRVSGHRRFTNSAVVHVGIILFLRDAGFSLAEIKQFVSAPPRSRGGWRALAERKAAELDALIAQATLARTALEHALACRHPDITTCPNFSAVVMGRLAGESLDQAHARVHREQ